MLLTAALRQKILETFVRIIGAFISSEWQVISAAEVKFQARFWALANDIDDLNLGILSLTLFR